MGLSICKTIAEAHGGHMEIESTEGHGTTVRIDLAAAANSPPGAGIPHLSADPLNVNRLTSDFSALEDARNPTLDVSPEPTTAGTSKHLGSSPTGETDENAAA